MPSRQKTLTRMLPKMPTSSDAIDRLTSQTMTALASGEITTREANRITLANSRLMHEVERQVKRFKRMPPGPERETLQKGLDAFFGEGSAKSVKPGTPLFKDIETAWRGKARRIGKTHSE